MSLYDWFIFIALITGAIGLFAFLMWISLICSVAGAIPVRRNHP